MNPTHKAVLVALLATPELKKTDPNALEATLPELLSAARIIAISRAKSPTPAPVVVANDLSETVVVL